MLPKLALGTLSTVSTSAYVLGSDEPEIARLDAQASSIAAPTDTLLRAAGIGGDMRVLDLGTGLGHVAFLVAALLEDGGSVLGVDREERLLEIAERRRAAAGHDERRVRAGRRADLHVRGAVRRDRRAADALPPARPRGGAAAPDRRAQAGRDDAARRVRHRRRCAPSRTRRSSPRRASGWRRRSGPSARTRGSAHAPGSSSAARASRTCRPSGSCLSRPARSDRADPVRRHHPLARAADPLRGHRDRGGAGTRHAAGARRRADRRARTRRCCTPAVVGAWGKRP